MFWWQEIRISEFDKLFSETVLLKLHLSHWNVIKVKLENFEAIKRLELEQWETPIPDANHLSELSNDRMNFQNSQVVEKYQQAKCN